ncbi:hypothetical protein EBU71_11875 [bacterium]|nr:hypothetical protein [Candidatus Elulimicrobium humile]
MPYSSVVFNEGEPLDPNKLNQLQTNLSDIYKTSSSLYNATLNEQGSASVPIVYSGQRTWPTSSTLKAGSVNKSQAVALPSSFDLSAPIYTTASVAQPLPTGTQITVSAYISNSNLYVEVIPTKDISGLIVHYTATQQKAI